MRGRLIVLLAVLAVCASAAEAQIIHPTSGTSSQTVSGGEVFYDSGGAGGNYQSGESGVTVLCNAGGAAVTLTVDSFAVEECNACGCFDTVTFYSGSSTSDPVIFSGCGDYDDNCSGNAGVCIQAGDVFTSTSADGCLTVGFGSDGSITYFGWEMTVSVAGGQTGADLAVTKTSDATGTVYPGDQITYTFGVTNNGPDDATGVAVTDALPAEVGYVSDTCSGSYDGGSHTWTWAIGALANGASATCDMVVEVLPGANGTVTNTATVAGNETDPAADNDASTVAVTASAAVPGIPALGAGGTTLLILLLAAGAIFVIRRRVT